jgi:UDP-glucose 4-epimerase
VLRIYGNDYPTPDGTGVRDYIHVKDLAAGHVAGVRRLLDDASIEHDVINLGTGRGHSVMEVLSTFMRVSGQKVPYEISERRPGDIATSFADVTLANAYLGWQARLDLDRMCADAWRWQAANPSGLASV